MEYEVGLVDHQLSGVDRNGAVTSVFQVVLIVCEVLGYIFIPSLFVRFYRLGVVLEKGLLALTQTFIEVKTVEDVSVEVCRNAMDNLLSHAGLVLCVPVTHCERASRSCFEIHSTGKLHHHLGRFLLLHPEFQY